MNIFTDRIAQSIVRKSQFNPGKIGTMNWGKRAARNNYHRGIPK